MGFVNLHNHSEYSQLDGMSKLEDMADKVKKHHQTGIALTDHGTLSGAYKFNKVCVDAGIKPLIGVEAYFTEDRSLRGVDDIDEKSYHLIMLAKNDNGLKNIFTMNSKAWESGLYYKGRVDQELLETYGEDVIITTSCLGSRVAKLYRKESPHVAEQKILTYKSMFGDNFFLELQDHEIPEQIALNEWLLEISAKHNIPPILTTDSHYCDQQDGQSITSPHELLLGVQTRKTVLDNKKFSFDGREHWIKTEEEARQTVSKLNFPVELVTNTEYVASMINGRYFLENKNRMPRVPGDMKSADEQLETASKWGLVDRFGGVDKVPQKYKEQLAYELDVIKKLGYSDYFLIVQDFTMWAVNAGHVIGAGRGSAAGSLVAWALKLTAKEADPIRHGLIFERFLNPGRGPNLDLDKEITSLVVPEDKGLIGLPW